MSIRLLSFLALLLLAPSFARADLRSDCVRLFDRVSNTKTDVARALSETTDWASLIGRLEKDVSPFSRQPFVVSFLDGGEFKSIIPPAADLSRIRLNVGETPLVPVPKGGKIVRAANFGYELPDEFRRIGPFSYVVLDAKGAIAEIGTATKLAMGIFKRHWYGVEFTPKMAARISELNQKLFSALRADPVLRGKLGEFAAARNLPPGIVDEFQLAYFHPDLFSVSGWAERNGFSMAELVDAGWYRVSLDRSGKPAYVMNSLESIKIPFLPAKGTEGIPVWRSRNLAKGKPDLPKYIGWQIDRSVNRRLSVAERLFNGGKLAEAKGKTIIVTEGEIKCMVAEKATGIPTFGIPGITEFDDEMVRALVDADAAEYIVILDRDPHGKALLRADEVTDSNRAAYTLASDLERLGAKKVRVGTLPEMKSGEKLGIDDLAIKYGTDPLFKTVADAVSAKDFAASIGLNTEFQEVLRRRTRLRKAVRAARIRASRTSAAVDEALLKTAEERLDRLTRTFKDYLENELNGARTIGSASGKVNSIREAGPETVLAGKTATLRRGEAVEMERFSNDILLLDYVPSDIDWKACRPNRCGQLPFSKNEIVAAFMGASASGEMAELLRIARGIASEAAFEPKSLPEFSRLLIAARLTRSFPLDEYRFEFGMTLGSGTRVSTVPLTVFKRNSGRAVAFANLHLPTGDAYWIANEAESDKILGLLRGP